MVSFCRLWCAFLLIWCSYLPELVYGLPALPRSGAAPQPLAPDRTGAHGVPAAVAEPPHVNRPAAHGLDASGAGPHDGAGGSFSSNVMLSVSRLVRQILVSDRPSPKPGVHEVEHIGLLNNSRFWWLMGAVVLCVGLAVVKMEVDENKSREAEIWTGGKKDEERGNYTVANAMHLCSCVVALNVAMLIWGVGQEFVMTNLYEDSNGNREKVPNTLFVVLCNRMVCVFFSGLLMLLHGKNVVWPGVAISAMPAISNLLASWCQYQSLDYISFALQTTVKSAKLLPVVFVSSLRGKRYTMQDYAEVLVIAAALVIFGLETEGGSEQTQDHSTEFGLLLLLGLLCFDSLTPHFQDYMFKAKPELNAIQATFAMSSVASVCAFLVLGLTGQLSGCVGFMARNPQSMLHIAVLSLASTLTQFLISHTIKYFGPVVFTLIATTRQAISVSISAAFFKHRISALAVVAAVLLFSAVMVRTLRPLATPARRPRSFDAGPGSRSNSASSAEALLSRARLRSDSSQSSVQRMPSSSIVGALDKWSQHWQLLVCAVGIHVLFCFYAMAQEFISIHTFMGELFTFPLFLIAVNRTAGALFAWILLKAQGFTVFNSKMQMTILPAVPNFLATVPQYQALYRLYFPAQVLMKSMKVIPVMLCGRLMKNRSYSRIDYAEGFVITVLVTFFVWDFQLHKGNLSDGNIEKSATGDLVAGSFLMLAYVLMDSLTSNLEDYVYQAVRIDPAQQMFGIEVFSGVIAWTILILSGEFFQAVSFFWRHPNALQFVGLLAISSALGVYACTVTVRLFGPAVLTLLMVSRQIISLVISVLIFQHTVDWLCCFCLSAVSLLVLTASLRQVGQQVQQAIDREAERERKASEGIGEKKLSQDSLCNTSTEASPADGCLSAVEAKNPEESQVKGPS